MTAARAAARVLAHVLAVLALSLGAAVPGSHAWAGQLRYCDPPAELDAAQQDVLLRFGDVVRATLEASGASLALVGRSGLDLGRFDMRYSHAGIALRASANAPWSVRQLYFDCGERRPRLFDEGVAGFLMGAGNAADTYVSVVLLPGGDAEAALERAALDDRLALRLVGATYSANAYPYAQRFQNCNQWVAELLGTAWGDLAGVPGDLRIAAQGWLREAGYEPASFEVGNPAMMWLAAVLPWLHHVDHPPEDLAAGRFRVSMPQSIEAFARARVPGARRVEFCLAGSRVVVREGWSSIAEGCVAADGDRVIELDR